MKTMMMDFLLMLMFFLGLLSFSLKRKHILMMLLSMEFIILSLMMMMFLYFLNFSNEFYFSLIFLSFSVCESALGLALLVSLIRSHGMDYFNMFILLW